MSYRFRDPALKEQAMRLRHQGISMTVIERELGIARSTLSGWFKNVRLTEVQRTRLMQNSRDGWLKARPNAHQWHRKQKAMRMFDAKVQAIDTLKEITLTDEILDLAFAMLYWGEGAKSDTTSIASSDPKILRFVLAVLRRNYGVTPHEIRFELHLRMDQSGEELKMYWSKELDVPLERFKYVAYDKRSQGKPTYDHYKGVCDIRCGKIAIQRKLIYLYNLFSEEVSVMDIVGD